MRCCCRTTAVSTAHVGQENRMRDEKLEGAKVSPEHNEHDFVRRLLSTGLLCGWHGGLASNEEAGSDG